MRGRVHVLMKTLKAEQAVTQERAKQVDEVSILFFLSSTTWGYPRLHGVILDNLGLLEEYNKSDA